MLHCFEGYLWLMVTVLLGVHHVDIGSTILYILVLIFVWYLNSRCSCVCQYWEHISMVISLHSIFLTSSTTTSCWVVSSKRSHRMVSTSLVICPFCYIFPRKCTCLNRCLSYIWSCSVRIHSSAKHQNHIHKKHRETSQ